MPRKVLWNNLPYVRVLVTILFGKCSYLPDLLTKDIGRPSLAIVVFWSCCCKFRSLCYCRRRSWLGLVSSPFLRGWDVISCPILHYKTCPQVLLLQLISQRGGERMRWCLLLRWFGGARRHSDSIWGRNIRRNCFLHFIPLKTMRLSVLSISCRFSNIVFSRLDGSLDSRATSLPTFLLFLWTLLARV